MIEFQWPWVLVLCVLPFITLPLLKPKLLKAAPLLVPEIDSFKLSIGSLKLPFNFNVLWRSLLVCVMWCCLIAAIAQPRLTGELTALPTTGRDLYLAVDVSGSMNTEDVLDLQSQSHYVTRLDAVKSVVTSFLFNRAGDRIGLIVFGTRPYVYAPLTFDLETIDQLLNEAPGGIAGTQTSIGDTVGLAIKRLRARDAEHRTLVLLTDGEQTVGSLSIEDAAGLAASNNVKIYTIAFGGMGRGLLSGFMPQQLDFRPLEKLALETGGRHFRATSTEMLQRVYETIDQLEAIDQDPETFRPVKALFYWPLTVALVCFLILWFTGFRVNV
ncbi:MAG: VWA domain-containing protein [Gammaproteobacteria bacterium]|nr:VWA domain-containing protein [Gammaproteobacteria bacterium]